MGRWAWIVVALLCTVLVGALVPGAVAQSESTGVEAGHASAQQDGTTGVQEQEFQRLELRLRVQPDGDVVWTYRYEYPIESEEDEAAFRDYAEQFEAEETAFYREWRNQSRQLTASASDDIGRQMEAVDFRREADVEQTPTREVGYVELTYRWTNFARQEGDEVHVGDVFVGGFYLDEGQSLVFEATGNLTFQSVAPPATTSASALSESESVSWTGERSFSDRHPRATLVRQDEAAGGGSMGLGGPALLGGGLALLVLALLTVAFVRGDLPEVGPLDRDEVEPVATDGSAAADVTEPEPDPVEQSATATEEPTARSDDERVLELLEESDGRMKQSAIVDETEWSKSKVSMLLSDMEEEGVISKIQVGRENIIALQGREPDAAGSPFDENE